MYIPSYFCRDSEVCPKLKSLKSGSYVDMSEGLKVKLKIIAVGAGAGAGAGELLPPLLVEVLGEAAVAAKTAQPLPPSLFLDLGAAGAEDLDLYLNLNLPRNLRRRSGLVLAVVNRLRSGYPVVAVEVSVEVSAEVSVEVSVLDSDVAPEESVVSFFIL